MLLVVVWVVGVWGLILLEVIGGVGFDLFCGWFGVVAPLKWI